MKNFNTANKRLDKILELDAINYKHTTVQNKIILPFNKDVIN